MADDRLVFLHGFTQTHHHWHECAHMIAERLGTTPTLTFVDLPGHGLSSSDRSPFELTAAELGEVGGRGTYIGYSMGGRMALAATVSGAPMIRRLVLVGATAGIDDPRQRQARVADDERRAARIEQVGVEAFVTEWLSAPMFSGLRVTASDRDHRNRNTAAGLASSLRLAGTGAQRPLWDAVAAINVPVLVLAGERDEKFCALGQRLAAAIPSSTWATIPGAGHAAHSERPAATADLIARWLDRS